MGLGKCMSEYGERLVDVGHGEAGAVWQEKVNSKPSSELLAQWEEDVQPSLESARDSLIFSSSDAEHEHGTGGRKQVGGPVPASLRGLKSYSHIDEPDCTAESIRQVPTTAGAVGAGKSHFLTRLCTLQTPPHTTTHHQTPPPTNR